jgi:hypothetical protein
MQPRFGCRYHLSLIYVSVGATDSGFGRDIANVVRIDGRWVIAAIEENARTECGAH